MIQRVLILGFGALLCIFLGSCNKPPTPAPNAPPPHNVTPAAATGEAAVPEAELIATVNDEPIFERDVLELAEPLLLRQGYHPGTDAWRQALDERRANLLDTLIADQLIMQHARDAKVVIANQPELIEKGMDDFRRIFDSDEAYRQALREREMSEADLRKQILGQLRRAEFIRQKGETKPWQVEPEEVIAYYNQHPEFFRDRVRLKVIAVYVPIGATAEVREEKRGRAELARSQLEGGVDFDTVAKQFSDDFGASETGGDLGFMRLDEIDPPIANAVKGMQEEATVGPLESPAGFHIVRLVKRGQTLQDGNLFEQLKQELEERKKARNVAEWLNRVKLGADIVVASPYYRKYFPAMEVYR